MLDAQAFGGSVAEIHRYPKVGLPLRGGSAEPPIESGIQLRARVEDPRQSGTGQCAVTLVSQMHRNRLGINRQRGRNGEVVTKRQRRAVLAAAAYVLDIGAEGLRGSRLQVELRG